MNGIEKGLYNLLVRCANIESQKKVLLVHEEEKHGFCDMNAVVQAKRYCDNLGATTEVIEIPFTPEAPVISPSIRRQMEEAEIVIFFARLVDQIRFRDFPSCSKTIMNYASTTSRLESSFGCANYEEYCNLKFHLDSVFSNAKEIRVTCPRGTDFTGPGDKMMGKEGDVSIIRYPMLVFSPISAKDYSGKIAIPGFLIGTSCNYYPDYFLELEETLFVMFEGERLLGFEGKASDVDRANSHLDFVSERYGLDRNRVFSWHAGIHPGNVYHENARINPMVWCSTCFGNPRLLHFHTCGNEPPGEISWNVLDPTICVDGVEIWTEGKFNPHTVPGATMILDQNPEIKELMDHPGREIGLDL
ncbi:MAG: hypothetical protein F4044_05125 [Rhodobacteraceae bacterium]|nr:hypothetical protein [Paracoccaceae bacterium]